MAIGSVSVEVVPDARGFHKKLSAELRDLTVKVNVNLDDAKAKAQLDKLAASSRSVKINADADTKAATAKLDELARTRTASVKANVDKSSFAQANSAVDGLGSKIFTMGNAIAALGPALIPATAALAGLAGALAAPLATAGAGGGLFAILGTAAIAKASKDAKAIQQLRQQADKAADPKKAAAYTKQADALLATLPKSEQAFLRARTTIGKGFDALLRNGNIFQPLAAGATLLGKVLPQLSPITDAFGKAITGVVTQLTKFSSSSGFRSAVNFIAKQGSAAFKQFVGIARDVGVGIGGLIKAFAPLGTSVLSSIERATGAFRRFGEAAGAGKSQGFQNFLAFVRKVGPQVGRTLVDVGRAVGNLVAALAPQGSTVLGVIDVLARTVAKMTPGHIAAVAVAVGALGIATGKFSGVKGLSLLVAGLSYAYNHSSAFHTLAVDAGHLAENLNRLPDVAKIAGGVAALSALKLGRGVGQSAGGGIVSKVLGGGVQKVFVVNMGEGLGGPGFGKTVARDAEGGVGKTVLRGAEKGATGLAAFAAPEVVIPAAALVALAAIVVKLGKKTDAPGQSNDVAFRHPTASNPVNSKLGPSAFLSGDLGRLGKIAQQAAPATKNWDQAVAALDGHYASLKKTNPAAAMSGLQDLSKKTGLSMAQLNVLLPKSTAAFGNFRKAASKITMGLGTKSAALDLNEFRFNAAKAGVSSTELAKKMHSLPKFVQTKILTPGALKSKADVKALVKQFGLTPKQTRTIMQLLGYRDTKQKLTDTIKTAKVLNRTSAKPHVDAPGADPTNTKIKGVTKSMRVLNQTSAHPHVTVETGGAEAAIRSVRGMLSGINGDTAHTYIVTTHRDIRVGGSKGTSANPTANATGGWIRGAGTATSDSIHALLSNGEFVVNAAAARRNASLLEAINGRGSTGNHLAAGGPVTNRTAAASGLSINYNGPVYAHDPDALARKQAARDRVAIALMVAG